MAFSAVWIAIASLIAAFDITKAVDENGEIIEPSQEYSSALVVYVSDAKLLDKITDSDNSQDAVAFQVFHQAQINAG